VINDKWQQTVNNGAAAFKDKRYADAEVLMREALQEAEKLQDELLVAVSLDNLGEVYFEQSKLKEAEPLYQRALAIRERKLDPGHSDIVASLNNLSALYFYQGKHAQAEPICKQLIEIYEKVLGAEHPEVATGINNLGLLCAAQKKYQDAETHFRRALTMR